MGVGGRVPWTLKIGKGRKNREGKNKRKGKGERNDKKGGKEKGKGN